MKALPEAKRSVVTLFCMNEYTVHEIAAFLDVPVGTVKSRLFAARKMLKKEMEEMVTETIGGNSLSNEFTESTIQKALTRAKALQDGRDYHRAEAVLKTVQDRAPNHPDILKALNRNLMHGGILGKGEWDRLSEIVRQARAIIESGSSDLGVMRDTARTLLCIPNTEEAISFIREIWLDRAGPSFEPLSMLAWAEGCRGMFDASSEAWQTAVVRAELEQSDLPAITLGCSALVDCLANAGRFGAAENVARQGWKLAAEGGDHAWLGIFHQAGIGYDEIARTVLARSIALEDAGQRMAEEMAIRVWTDDFEVFLDHWLTWIRSRDGATAMREPESVRSSIRSAFKARKQPYQFNQWARTTWEAICETKLPEAKSETTMWNWHQYDTWLHIESGEFNEAEQIVRQAIERVGYRWYAPMLIQIVAARGEPTPEDLKEQLEKGGIDAVDDYGMFGKYLAARIAAESGDDQTALRTLSEALAYWRNPPLSCVDVWEKDAAWGSMLAMPERKQLFIDKRDGIGPIFGELHYFPGW
jgi:tetratricopeptide (TPR) repeat protein